MISVLTWLWTQKKSRTVYTAEHVNIWADMVRRNLSMPHRIACVTDIPEGIDAGVEIIAPPGEFVDWETPRWRNGRPSCYRRLSMFRPDAAKIFGKRFVCMDLDVAIGGALDPLFDRDEEIVLFKGTAPDRPYNGSMLMMTAGCRPHVYEKFDFFGALEASGKFVGSDQAWLAHALGPDEAVWDERDGAYFYGSRYRSDVATGEPRIVFFPGSMKPWSPLLRDEYTGRHYRMTDRREAA